MDLKPFTLFFMVCLLGFQGSWARPQQSEEAIVWPEKCAGKTYCTDNSTYPKVETFKEALGLADSDLSAIAPSIGNRIADSTCRYNSTLNPIYMIKDDEDVAWYVVQVPGIHEFRVEIKQCLSNETPMGLTSDVKCVQTWNKQPFIVLSHDKTKVETVYLKGKGLPASCSPKVV